MSSSRHCCPIGELQVSANWLSPIELLIKSSFTLGRAWKLTSEYTSAFSNRTIFFVAPAGALREHLLLKKHYFGRKLFFSVAKFFLMLKHRKFSESSTIPSVIFWITLFLIERSAQLRPVSSPSKPVSSRRLRCAPSNLRKLRVFLCSSHSTWQWH